jgi:hypothetical protein
MTTKEERFREQPADRRRAYRCGPGAGEGDPRPVTKHLMLGAQMRSALRRFPM